MARHKGSGPAVDLTEAQFTALVVDIKRFGNNVVARKAGLSKNYISMIIKRRSGISINTLGLLRDAIKDLKKINSGSGNSESTVIDKVASVTYEA
ncbi:hypothetical protein FAES_1798 [Fibrella aestuarina BUZ 2]|uniref:HTH cro/C1-type domain-containing protein n=1 Tax=Fibrella aestuarina BUZ 2 TaxID=1166018 RepID=I0K6Q5_9BACT|nr:transcriptional regulator [Fibrella aestuarina]CCG99808.1 hypothetical protein FAES_1798 [Fibrella aestuarina BUZ 2]